MSGYTEIALLQYEIEKLRARIAELDERRCEVCGYAEHHREHTGCLRKQIEKLTAERDAAITNLRVEQIAHLSLTDLLEKENVQLKSALKVARDALEFYSDPHVAGQPATARKALTKINEVLHD